MLLLPQEAPHLKAVDVWEMGRNKMGGAIVGISRRLMRRQHLKLSVLHCQQLKFASRTIGPVRPAEVSGRS